MGGKATRKSGKRGLVPITNPPLTSHGRISVLAYPELMEEWDWEKNKAAGIDPAEVAHHSGKKAFWLCKKFGKDHSMEVSPDVRMKAACGFCSGRSINHTNCLATTHPELAKEWSSKNDKTAYEVHAGSRYRAKWICCKFPEIHNWETEVRTRAKMGHGCRFCAGQDVTDDNRLTIFHPDVSLQWDYDKNGELKPEHFARYSSRKAHWKCARGHSWIAKIADRTFKGAGCATCTPNYANNPELILPEHTFAHKYPQLVKLWHTTKNGELKPNQITHSHSKKIYWLCPNNPDHDWIATTDNVIKGKRCAICNKFTSLEQVRSLLINIENVDQFTINDFISAINNFDQTLVAKGRAKIFFEGVKQGRISEKELKEFLNSDKKDLQIIQSLWKIQSVSSLIARPGISPDIRKRVYERDDYTCQICKVRGGRLSIDHFIPWLLGGNHTEENFWTICLKCNRSKQADLPGPKTLENWKDSGRIVPQIYFDLISQHPTLVRDISQ